mmetsp:Transcript_45786/g.151819  ORF Transcript_45786/g.151819 Transcript_45786/m.151819 type:complete len:322 (-) Transcript_45786:211-1176(-)
MDERRGDEHGGCSGGPHRLSERPHAALRYRLLLRQAAFRQVEQWDGRAERQHDRACACARPYSPCQTQGRVRRRRRESAAPESCEVEGWEAAQQRVGRACWTASLGRDEGEDQQAAAAARFVGAAAVPEPRVHEERVAGAQEGELGRSVAQNGREVGLWLQREQAVLLAAVRAWPNLSRPHLGRDVLECHKDRDEAADGDVGRCALVGRVAVSGLRLCARIGADDGQLTQICRRSNSRLQRLAQRLRHLTQDLCHCRRQRELEVSAVERRPDLSKKITLSVEVQVEHTCERLVCVSSEPLAGGRQRSSATVGKAIALEGGG